MLLNYLKIAWRNIITQKGYSFLNITGLAIGLAAVILIFIYVQDETSYDTIHPDYQNLFGIGEELTTEQGEKFSIPAVPSGWAQLLKERVPGVVETLHVSLFGYPHSMRNPENDKTILTQDGEIFMVDPTYGKMLFFPLKNGSKQDVFSQPNSIVLSEKAAKRLSGSTDIVGRALEVKNIFISKEYTNLKVIGVMDDYPSNSHIRPDYLMSLGFLDTSSSFQELMGGRIPTDNYFTSMDRVQMPTYIRIQDGVDISEVQAGIERLIKEVIPDKADQHKPFLTNIADFHFDEKVDWSGWDSSSSFDFIIVFIFIGLIILIIACINYMNLATARSIKRSKEVGVRKSLGSSRGNLIAQFFQEALLTSFLGMVAAIIIVMLVIPAFNSLADKSFTMASFFTAEIFIGLLLIWLLVAFVASSYPALFLSSFRPSEVLKGNLVIGKGHMHLRKSLVVSQLVISVLMIICTDIVLKQMGMLENSKLHENSEQIVSIRYGGGIAPFERYQTLKNEILSDPDIRDVTMSVHLPQRWGPWETSVTVPDLSGGQEYKWNQLFGDYDFPEMFDLEFIAGRSFRTGSPGDSMNVVLNEAAVRNLNKTPEEVLGLPIKDVNTNQISTVIGVVKDFSFESIRTKINPMAIYGKPQLEDQILYVKLPVDKLGEKLTMLEDKWKKVMPEAGFDYWFLSEEFGRMYATEKKMTNLIWFFSLLAVFIACLGLYGLASYSAEQKTKEIGIRKVLGANGRQILGILISDFLKMVFIASIIAFPIGYWIMDKWLENFAYRVNIGWDIFLISLGIIFGLTLISVSYESIKASLSQPVKSLKHE